VVHSLKGRNEFESHLTCLLLSIKNTFLGDVVIGLEDKSHLP